MVSFHVGGIRAILLAVAIAASGCSNAAKPVKTYTLVKAPGPLDEVRALLVRYVEGQPVGSEVTIFDGLVARVREADPDRAAMLDEGLTAIAKSPATAASKARKLLGDLGLSQPSR